MCPLLSVNIITILSFFKKINTSTHLFHLFYNGYFILKSDRVIFLSSYTVKKLT